MSLNKEIVKHLGAGFMERRSLSYISDQTGSDIYSVLDQLEHLREHGFALRWSDSTWSLSKHGERLKTVMLEPAPRTNGRTPV